MRDWNERECGTIAVMLAMLRSMRPAAFRGPPFLPARRYASASFAVITCLSVRLSVTSRSCTKTAKEAISKRTSHNSPGTLRNSNGLTLATGVPIAGGVGKNNCTFRPAEKSPAQTPYCRKFVSIPPRWSASSMVRWRRNMRYHQQLWW